MWEPREARGSPTKSGARIKIIAGWKPALPKRRSPAQRGAPQRIPQPWGAADSCSAFGVGIAMYGAVLPAPARTARARYWGAGAESRKGSTPARDLQCRSLSAAYGAALSSCTFAMDFSMRSFT